MSTTVKTSISIEKTLFNQAEVLAQQLNISQSRVFEMAIENFIRQHSDSAIQSSGENRVINQGDVYWAQFENPTGLEPGIPHPYVVIQHNVLNHSRINSVVVCVLTSNIKRANAPGNVLLEADEANLPRQSIVEVSKVSTVDKAQLGEYIGSLSEQRIDQILTGMRFLQKSFFAR